MIKIGLNQESRDDFSGTFPLRVFVIVYLPFRYNLSNIQPIDGNFLFPTEDLVRLNRC